MREKLIQYLKKYKRLLNFLRVTRRLLFRYRFFFTYRRIIKNYLISHQTRKLQIGSSKNYLKGWLNTDIDSRKDIVFLEATKRFPFANCTFDYVFSEHLIEHFEYQDGLQFIQECYRILRPRGKIRISTPDLRFLIKLYTENKTELQEQYIIWTVNSWLSPDIKIYSDTFVINNFFRNWGHKFIYDYKTLRDVLDKCGFVDIATYSVGESDDKNLRGIESHDLSMPGGLTSEFNKLESMVVEGTKPI